MVKQKMCKERENSESILFCYEREIHLGSDSEKAVLPRAQKKNMIITRKPPQIDQRAQEGKQALQQYSWTLLDEEH